MIAPPQSLGEALSEPFLVKDEADTAVALGVLLPHPRSRPAKAERRPLSIGLRFRIDRQRKQVGARSRLPIRPSFELGLLRIVREDHRIVSGSATSEGEVPLLILKWVAHGAIWREAKVSARKDAAEGRLASRVVEEVTARVEADSRHESHPKS